LALTRVGCLFPDWSSSFGGGRLHDDDDAIVATDATSSKTAVKQQ